MKLNCKRIDFTYTPGEEIFTFPDESGLPFLLDVYKRQGRCYLSWPLTDKERDAGDYSKRFTKGQIYRIKARGWKGDALYRCV